MDVSRVLVNAFLLFGLSAAGQENRPIPLTNLKRTPIFVSIPGRGIIGNANCDSDGNIYLRRQLPRTDAGLAPLYKISKDGQSVLAYDFSNLDLPNAVLSDFSITPDDEVYALIESRNGSAIAKMSREGSVQSKALLEAPVGLVPTQLANLSRSRFFVSGSMYDGEHPEVRPLAFVGIYDAAGRLLQEITPARTKAKSDKTLDFAKVQAAIETGVMIPARDGRIFWLKNTDPAEINVFSSDGKILHQFKVPSPEKDFSPSTMKLSGGRLILDFNNSKWNSDSDPTSILDLFSVVDAETGNAIIQYARPGRIKGAFICQREDEFVFAGMDGARFTVTRATP